MAAPRITVTRRTPSPIDGFTTVHAFVDNGVTGEYMIADRIVGTQQEFDEIRAQSNTRLEIRLATQAGQD